MIMENFDYLIQEINEYGQTLVEFTPNDSSLKTLVVSVRVPNETLEDPNESIIKQYVSQFSPQLRWDFETGFEISPVLNTQHIGVTGDETDIPLVIPDPDDALIDAAIQASNTTLVVDSISYLGNVNYINQIQFLIKFFDDYATGAMVDIIDKVGALQSRSLSDLEDIEFDWYARARSEEISLQIALTDESKMNQFHNRVY
jgi:hypothetical protein